MDVLVVSHFCMDFSETDNDRFFYICKQLAEKGYNVELVTSSFYHAKKIHRENVLSSQAFKTTFLPEKGYRKNISVARITSHAGWGRNLQKYLRNRRRPDVVYCAVPSLTGPARVGRICKSRGVPFIVDIQDLWPEAFRIAFSVPVISELMFFPFQLLANGIYRRADEICAVSHAYVDRALRVNKKTKSGLAVYLGTELQTFDANADKYKVVKEDTSEFWVGYCGSMGDSYDLRTVIDAIALLDRPVRLVAMGDGQDREELIRYAENKKIKAEFTGRLPYDQMCGKLAACDVAVNPIVGKSVASIINKHADYAAAGIPVVNTQQSMEYQQLVKRYQMGFNCKTGDAADMAEKLELLAADPELRQKMGKSARVCAEQLFDRSRTYQSIFSLIESYGENVQ